METLISHGIDVGYANYGIGICVFLIIIISDAPIWLKADIPIFYRTYLPIPITDPIFYIKLYLIEFILNEIK